MGDVDHQPGAVARAVEDEGPEGQPAPHPKHHLGLTLECPHEGNLTESPEAVDVDGMEAIIRVIGRVADRRRVPGR